MNGLRPLAYVLLTTGYPDCTIPCEMVRNGARFMGDSVFWLELVANCGRSFLGIILAPKENGASLLSLPCALNA